MGLFNKLFKGKNRKAIIDTEDTVENGVISRADIDISNSVQREKFIQNCLEQMEEASTELEKGTFEYNIVTNYLTDVEEIEALPEEERKELNESANEIAILTRERKDILGKKNRISERHYRIMENLEDEMPEAYDKLKDCEILQLKIKKDLRRISGEKDAFRYRREELETGMDNVKGITVICGVATVVCVVLLMVLNLMFFIPTTIGFVIISAMTLLATGSLFYKYKGLRKEYKLITNNINKIILLQNAVKIRFVNNTHLLEYLRLKFSVNNAKELKILWTKYQEEKIIREKDQLTKSDLAYYKNALFKQLTKYQIHDPAIWDHQVEAIIDAREMVEIKHDLVVRRQALRKQMEYNKEIAKVAQNEIKIVIEKYPEYKDSIMDLVAKYESN